MNTEMTALNTGIDLAADADPAKAKAKSQEQADVKRWFQTIHTARKFDESAREQFARDRRHARGDAGGQVTANIVGTNIDILEAFLYAKDPDFDVSQAPSVRPPTLDAMRDAVEDQVRDSPEVKQAGMQALQLAMAQGMDLMTAAPLAEQAQNMAAEEMIAAQVEQMRKAFAVRSREIKALAQTCEVIGSSMWHDAGLKRRGRPLVRSALTIGFGVLKASWQERTGTSPETAQAINDLQANIARARSLEAQLETDNPGLVEGIEPTLNVADEAKMAELERQLATLQGQAERVVARGFVVDNVHGEDFDVAPGYTIANHLDAPWNSHRIFISYQDALAEFGPHLSLYGKPEELLKGAKQYRARKPEMRKDESALLVKDTIDAKDADAYVDIADSSEATDSEGGDCHFFVALREIWDRDSNTVLTGIEGVKCWVKPAWNPSATTRFYPFFVLPMSEVDGQRYPQSPVSRTNKLVDEYNRIGSAEAEHRRRILPKTMFHSGAISPDSVKKLEAGTAQEMVGVETTQPQMGLENLLVPVVYAAIDPGLYDRSRIIQEIERVFGVQEALAGAVNTAKTATEAEIQQSGFQARTAGRRDALEGCLSELAEYTVEVARVYITEEDARSIAGPDAYWPAYGGPDDLTRMVDVRVRAGTSGKPDTTAEQQSWSTMLPILQAGVVQIGQLRGVSPLAVADSLEEIMRMTAEKMGANIDMDVLIPRADAAVPMMPGMGGPPMPGAPAGNDPDAGMPPAEPAQMPGPAAAVAA